MTYILDHILVNFLVKPGNTNVHNYHFYGIKVRMIIVTIFMVTMYGFSLLQFYGNTVRMFIDTSTSISLKNKTNIQNGSKMSIFLKKV